MLMTRYPKCQDDAGFARSVSRISEFWSFPMHRHEGFLELVYVHEGMMTHTVAGQALRQVKGDLVLVRDFDGHGLETDGNDFVFTNLTVSNQWLRQLEILWGDSSLVSGALARPGPLLVSLVPAEQSVYEQAMEQLESPPHQEGRRAVFSGFLINVLLKYFADPNLFGFGKEQMPEWLESVVSWIHHRREQPLRVADIVERANKCPEHISRSFSKYLGMTPSQYLNRQRLDYAAELLAGTNYPLLEICYRVGFDNPSYFHRLFKCTFGLQPMAYRKVNSRLDHL